MRKIGKYLIKGLLFLVGSLPLKALYCLSAPMAWLMRCVLRYRRSVVEDNIRQAYLDKTPAEIKRIVKDFYRHFADMQLEMIWFGQCRNPERLARQNIVSLEGTEALNEMYSSAPSVMVLTSHTGNWELFGGIETYSNGRLCFTENEFCMVYRQMESKVWDEIIADNRAAPFRNKPCKGYVETAQLIRYAFRHSAEKICYVAITDQRPYFKSPANIDVSFMGRTCKTMTGGAALAHKFGMAVCYLSIRNPRRGHYVYDFIPICADGKQMSVADMMKRYYELLEADLRAEPANYLWSHKRWKWATRG